MTSAIMKTNGAPAPIDIMAYAGGLSAPQVDLIKRSVITGGTRPVTNDELALFLTVCSRRGLDAFSGQVYGIMRKSREKDGTWVEKLVIQVGIDGYRLLAEQTGKYEGLAGPFWCGPDGQWTDVWLKAEPPSAAKVGVYRAGCREPFWGVVTYREYAQTRDGKPVGKWADMPATMLAKCSEAKAIRMAFPQAVGGLTTPETAGADTETFDVTDRDRETAAFNARRAAEQPPRGRLPWKEEIDDADLKSAIDATGRALEEITDEVLADIARIGSPSAPDVVLEAISAAATVQALEAVARREDWREDHQDAFDARMVEIVSAALDSLDWSRPQIVEGRLKVAAIKLDRIPTAVPGANLALDKLEVARQRLADGRATVPA